MPANRSLMPVPKQIHRSTQFTKIDRSRKSTQSYQNRPRFHQNRQKPQIDRSGPQIHSKSTEGPPTPHSNVSSVGVRTYHFHQNRPRFHQNRQRSTENPPQIAPVYIYILLQDVMLQTHSSPRREAASPPSPLMLQSKKADTPCALQLHAQNAVTNRALQFTLKKQRPSWLPTIHQAEVPRWSRSPNHRRCARIFIYCVARVDDCCCLTLLRCGKIDGFARSSARGLVERIVLSQLLDRHSFTSPRDATGKIV
jgi:hypothetical protein